MINHPHRSNRKSIASSGGSNTFSRHPRRDHDRDYPALLRATCSTFAGVTQLHGALFLTDAVNLNQAYLDGMLALREVHNCHACARFIKAYGGLAAIKEDGTLVPAFWAPEAVPAFYQASVTALAERVKRARVLAPFLSKDTIWGTPVTGPWTHFAANNGEIYQGRLLTPRQAMAAAKENFNTVRAALETFQARHLDVALKLFEGEHLARSEKFVAPLRWLRALHDRPRGRRGENVLWRAVAAAPEGYCHPRASVIGPLLEEIAAGTPFETIKAKFAAMLNPLRYQRPQAAPTAGNVAAAEALFEKLGLAPALERRFAHLEEIQTIWARGHARAPAATGTGIFGHVRPKGAASAAHRVVMPAVTSTWEKFARTVLPKARELELSVPLRGRFIALTTAVHSSAPPVLKWDSDEERNPVAWYVYPNGSPAQQWGLAGNTWASVNAIARFPNQWGSRPMPFIADGVVLILAGARDTRSGGGNALFPETLRDDLHGVRATIEAYSRGAQLSGRAEATACGYDVRRGEGAAGCLLRALVDGSWTSYRIDRWD